MADLQLQLSNTLIVRGYGVHFCVTNLTPNPASGIILESINEDGMLADSVTFGGEIPAYSMRCFSHSLDTWATTGHALLRASATVAGTTVYSNIHYAFITSGIAPGIPWDETRPVYMMGLAGGLLYGGFYKGSYIPRPNFIDYLVLDDVLTGSTAVLTRDEIDKGVQPVFKKNIIYQLRAEYSFRSKEALTNIILSQVPLLAEWFDLTQLSYDQIIDLGIPFLADKMLRERGVVAIRRTGETRLELVIHIASAGVPLALVILGIGVLASIGLGIYSIYKLEKHEAADAAAHQILWNYTTFVREEGWQRFWSLVNTLSPTAFQISKDEFIKQAKEMKEKGDIEVAKYRNALETATGGAQPAGISLWDKLKYGLIGAGVAVLLTRAAPLATPYVVERVERTRREE